MRAPFRYSDKRAGDPSIQGSLSIEDIVKRDWERNYAKKGAITLNGLRSIVKQHVDDGNPIARFRNTLFMITPEDDGFDVVKFHSITADSLEVYTTMLLMFMLGLNKARGTEEAYTYVPDKTLFRKVSPMFGGFADIEDAHDEDADATYKVTIDLEGFVQSLQAKAAQQAR